MKRHILRFNRKNYQTFLSAKKGVKRVETRAATPRYRNIAVGDTLVFACGEGRFSRKVKKVLYFKGISAMLKKFRIKDAMPDVKNKKGMEKRYYSFPGYRDKLKKYGIMAFTFK